MSKHQEYTSSDAAVDKTTYLYLVIGPNDDYTYFLYLAPLFSLSFLILVNCFMFYKSIRKINEIKTPKEGNTSYSVLSVLVMRAV